MSLQMVRHDEWSELILDSPPRNVLDQRILEDMIAALAEFADSGAPVLLLRSLGKHFSTGYSIQDIPEEIFHADSAIRAGAPFERVMRDLIAYPSPIVAAIQGDAYGGAVELLACADLRVAAEGVRLAVPPVRLGLVYSHTGLRRLLRGLGSSLVREMLLCGEPITAERAYQAGFLNRLVPATDLPAAALELLDALAKGGPAAIRGTCRVLNLLEEAETLSASEIEEIAQIRHQSRLSEEFQTARQAFLERRRTEPSG